MIKYEHHRSLKRDLIAIESVKNLNCCAHIHHSYEYVTVTAGKMKMHVSGVVFILSENDSVFILPGQIHAYEPVDGNDCVVDLIIFSPDYLPELYSVPHSGTLCTPLLSSCSSAPAASDILTVSKDKFLTKAKIYELASAYLHGEPFKVSAPSLDAFGARFLAYLAAHYTEPITLRCVAAALGYNYRYLSGMVNRCFGTSFSKIIGEYRTGYACELLCETGLDITEICRICGFESIRSFNRVFKQFCACTPSEYRQSVSLDS